jgi:sugar transferase EpsL
MYDVKMPARAARPGALPTGRAKRLIDLAAACAVLVGLAPAMAAVSALVATRLGRPVIFRQQRPGIGGRPFVMYKFRTMLEAYDEHGRPLPDEERLTPLGRFLRATSLDELPTFVNVLRGEMSLVGPRPLMMGYLDIYTPEQFRRLEVLPGITGWAQVNGRNALSFEETFDLDVWYVDHRSLRLDLLILARTVGQILRREGTVARKEIWEL